MIDLLSLLVLVLIGICAGLLSGMLGVGGGFIMVPVQFWLYSTSGYSDEVALRLAFATSLAVILPTALSSAVGHQRKGAVVWRAGTLLGVAAVPAAVFGAWLATLLPAAPLETFFGLVVLAAGARTFLAPAESNGVPEVPATRYLLWGVPVGLVSGLAGIGGGVILVPILTVALRFPMHRAVATSTVVMLAAASGGLATYMVLGQGVVGLPPLAVGYVDFFQAAVLAAASIPAAQAGALISHRMPARLLKGIFVVLTTYIGLRMIGVFSILGLPL
ncbi:sulfite exporter TauE/SafE family protein [Methanofollis ethanolicus]|uniref:sulfite exporter TauE/SafE family protein n=1 Tax=Methanofollis ethanolicus TaxID=488124 RepID=UPI00082A0FA4|nr:sulfite exporter TauE/SafE family protein [Methanofollis ethanolicus]